MGVPRRQALFDVTIHGSEQDEQDVELIIAQERRKALAQDPEWASGRMGARR